MHEHEVTQEELTEEYIWMSRNEVARTLAMRHASPVWTDRDGCLTPVSLMSARRRATLRAYLERRLAEFRSRDTAASLRLLDCADRNWYPGDQAVFDDLDRRDDDDPDRQWLEYWLLVAEAWSESEREVEAMREAVPA